jgi:hypothetical protein
MLECKRKRSGRKGCSGLNPKGCISRGRPTRLWKRTILEEAVKEGKTWNEVKMLAENVVH